MRRRKHVWYTKGARRGRANRPKYQRGRVTRAEKHLNIGCAGTREEDLFLCSGKNALLTLISEDIKKRGSLCGADFRAFIW